jgi:hypothetical protein
MTESLSIDTLVAQLRALGYEVMSGPLGGNTQFLALKGLSEKERADLSQLVPHIPSRLIAFEQRHACYRCGVVFLNVEGDCPVCYYRIMAGTYGLRMAELLAEKVTDENT